MVRLRHWLGWCRPGHCPIDGWVPADSLALKWIMDLGYRVEPCDCGHKHCQGWKKDPR
jgi:hypothetical protein